MVYQVLRLSEMDFPEAAKLVFNRIQSFDPENASKIVGYLLLQENGDLEILRTALGPDSLIQSLIHRAKSGLGLPGAFGFDSPSLSPVSTGPRLFQQYVGPELWVRPEFPANKTCHYFRKGFCKHGSKCKYLHGRVGEEEERSLEREIVELLRSRRGFFPVSIASLPMMYYEKYGKSLQAEGYLTESQRHGKTGFSLTNLLARLNNTIRLVDRPHGQHSVILVEDLQRYQEFNAVERNGGIVSCSRQIYLTFPAESTFTEHDVSNYFNKFGPVQDVRIPCQQERMFGFVTFLYPETVRHILSKGNPHFVCQARVLVKPYREKSRLVNRKFSDRMLHSMCRHFTGGNLELSSMPLRTYDKSRIKKQIELENEREFEFERRCLSDMNLASRILSRRPDYNYSMEELKLYEGDAGHEEFQSSEQLHYLFDVMNIDSTSDDNKNSTDYNDQDSQGLNLPESPFVSTIGSEISAFT